ncbi:MAG: SOS response-associated peptidase [Vicinamibacteria bacterium]
MCGRFTLTAPGDVVAEAFGLDETPELAPRYNAAPGSPVAALRARAGRRHLEQITWGWGGGPSEGGAVSLLINARSETAARKPAFREALLGRRCLVPADGFYEWRRAGLRREPFHFRGADGRPFGLAALWTPQPGGDALVVLTTAPNAVVAEIHDRMPVILPQASFAAWLDPGLREAEALEALLLPAPEGSLTARAVGPFVNDARNDGPRCLEPARQRSLF